MDKMECKNIVEILLLYSEKPLSLEKLAEAFDHKITRKELLEALAILEADYKVRALELVEVVNGFKIHSKAQYSAWIERLQFEKPSKYSRALLETLAIIAYKQPATRADIEELRGVAVNSNALKTLLEREWIRISGYKDIPGKPAVYSTTNQFLNYFNLRNLDELPVLTDVKDLFKQNENECLINES